jgi:hypothetical protein
MVVLLSIVPPVGVGIQKSQPEPRAGKAPELHHLYVVPHPAAVQGAVAPDVVANGVSRGGGPLYTNICPSPPRAEVVYSGVKLTMPASPWPKPHWEAAYPAKSPLISKEAPDLCPALLDSMGHHHPSASAYRVLIANS